MVNHPFVHIKDKIVPFYEILELQVSGKGL